MADEKAGTNGTTLKFNLRRKIRAHDDENVEVLTFREPTVMELERYGNPVTLEMNADGKLKMSYDGAAMTQIMATLAAVPPSSIRLLHPRDWVDIANDLAQRFFVPDAGMTPS